MVLSFVLPTQYKVALNNYGHICLVTNLRGAIDGHSGGTRSWWRHQMETFSSLPALCAGNPPITGEFPAQRPVTRSFGVFFDQRLNKRLSKQSWGWWFETPSLWLWRHCNAVRYMLRTSLNLFNALYSIDFNLHVMKRLMSKQNPCGDFYAIHTSTWYVHISCNIKQHVTVSGSPWYIHMLKRRYFGTYICHTATGSKLNLII